MQPGTTGSIAERLVRTSLIPAQGYKIATHKDSFVACKALANFFRAHSGLKSDIAEGPKSADNGLMHRARHALFNDSGRTCDQPVRYFKPELLGRP
jgi:hypothetical protein